MKFKRISTKGQNPKVQKTWLSEKQYRIVWRKEVFDVAVTPAFQATVRIVLPQGGEMWDFVCKRRLFRTQNAAQKACEKHERLWTKAIEATGARDMQKLFGNVPLGFPCWVKSKLNRKVHDLLMSTKPGKGY